MRAWFSYDSKVRTFSQKYEKKKEIREVKNTQNETSTSQTDVTREALVTRRKEVKPLVTSRRRVWRQKNFVAIE